MLIKLEKNRMCRIDKVGRIYKIAKKLKMDIPKNLFTILFSSCISCRCASQRILHILSFYLYIGSITPFRTPRNALLRQL